MMGEPSAPVAAGIRVVSRRDQGCLDWPRQHDYRSVQSTGL